MASYTSAGGLRIVPPYYRQCATTVKERWRNRLLLDVLTTEFREFSEDQHLQRIKNNQITVQRRIKQQTLELRQDQLLSERLKQGDVIMRRVHVHEPPIVDAEIETVYEDEEVLVVNKPAGVPIHPVQNFYYNTMVEILKRQTGLDELRPCFRLDKVTSGICILAKSVAKAKEIQSAIRNKQVRKVYVARVAGDFPESAVCNDDVVIVETKRGPRDGIDRKSATTEFKRLKYSSVLDESIVECRPLTGRTHQIRIHLRNMGFPIVNDQLYRHGILATNEDYSDPDVFERIAKEAESSRKEQLTDEFCKECDKQLFKAPDPAKLVLYLHAREYYHEENKWAYVTEYPEWTKI
ncbi:hypothetical protein KL928_003566 [Ogataea angusta]|uniref:Pseudouridine synthase n=1 Tax=Pichia angusta TaxID=870730 RepID=A0AAN6DD69_PICAN|nr:uncharacterized protein KL928_003566 [Ogataea angusta]KAG7817667.1 hypothetical protein KL928_003566 [Ogataea angusta]